MDKETYFVSEVSPFFFPMRHLLLQKSLRPSFSSYPIEEEYPALFSEDTQALSLGLFKDTGHEKKAELVAHLNLLEKKIGSLLDPEKSYPIGLIGNVATESQFRGKGLMTQLLKKAEELATKKSLRALILWGDHYSFYHKLGFETFGCEYRFRFSKKSISEFKTTTDFFVPLLDELDDAFLKETITLRPATPFYCLRTATEFRSLLTIPDTIFLMEGTGTKGSYKKNFMIIGKGCDMIGVIHEWGGTSPETILSGIKHILEVTGWESVQLLAPQSLESNILHLFRDWSEHVEQHPIGLVKYLESANSKKEFKDTLEKTYFWGLDSI